MQGRIDPKRVVLGMMPRSCRECGNIQHVFFPTQKEYDEWKCPECKGKELLDNPDEPVVE